MRFISTKTHAVMDYIVGALLILIPLAIRDQRDASVWVPVAVGAVLLLQSLMTDYELSAVRMVPMKVHLALDAIAGAFLAASPWLFDFADIVWAPHLIVGLAEIGLAFMTRVHRGEATQYPAESHRAGAL